MYSIVFISYVFLCFKIFLLYYLKLLISSHITSCKWPRRLKKLCFRAIYIICCFAHKRMENAGFCQILGRHASTKCHVTSRPVVGFSQNLFQKMRDTSTKKVTENCHAISGGCATAENFVQGGVNLTPPQ